MTPVIRPARLDESESIAAIYLAARARMTYIPSFPYFAPDPVRRYFRERLLTECEVHVAVGLEDILGFIALKSNWIEQLYLHPDYCGAGTGKALLNLAKMRFPEGLELWVLEANRRAIRFYEREGFITIERTDGASSMEKIPDRRMSWHAT